VQFDFNDQDSNRGDDMLPQPPDSSFLRKFDIPKEDYQAVLHALGSMDCAEFAEVMTHDYGLTDKQSKDLFDSRWKQSTPPNMPPGVGFSSPFNPQPFFSRYTPQKKFSINPEYLGYFLREKHLVNIPDKSLVDLSKSYMVVEDDDHQSWAVLYVGSVPHMINLYDRRDKTLIRGEPLQNSRQVRSVMQFRVGDHVTTPTGTEAMEVVKVNALSGKVIARDWQGRTKDYDAAELQTVQSAAGAPSFGPLSAPVENPGGVDTPLTPALQKKKINMPQPGEIESSSYARGMKADREKGDLPQVARKTAVNELKRAGWNQDDPGYQAAYKKRASEIYAELTASNGPSELSSAPVYPYRNKLEDQLVRGGIPINKELTGSVPKERWELLDGSGVEEGKVIPEREKKPGWKGFDSRDKPLTEVPLKDKSIIRQNSLDLQIQGALLVSRRGLRRPIQSLDINLKASKPQQWQQGFNDGLQGKNNAQAMQGDDQKAYLDGMTEAAAQKGGATPQPTANGQPTDPNAQKQPQTNTTGMPVGASFRRRPLNQQRQRTIGDRLYDYVDRAKEGNDAEALKSLTAFLEEHNLAEYSGDNKSVLATTSEIAKKADPDDIDIFLQTVEAGEAYTAFDAQANDMNQDLEMTDFTEDPMDQDLEDLEGDGGMGGELSAEDDQSLRDLEMEDPQPEPEAPVMPPGRTPREPNLEQ